MFDAHCHLEGFKNLDPVLAQCKGKLNGLVTCGFDLKSNGQNLEIALANPNYVWSVAGLAPQSALTASEDELRAIMDFIRGHEAELVAVGEIGLDYKWARDEAGRKRQMKAFEAQIALAKELDKPIVIHSRDADGGCVEALLKAGCTKVVLHCFSGTAELAQKAARAGFMVSIPPLRSKEQKKAIKSLELESLLAESDAPAIGKTPLACLGAAELVAELKGMDLAEVERVLEANCKRVFGI